MTEDDLLWILDRLAAGEAAGLAIPLLVTASWAAALIRALQQRIEEQGWRTIESAPKDGSIVLLTSAAPNWKYPFPAKWNKVRAEWVFADEPLNDIWAVSRSVSHWIPLPPPPAISSPRSAE